MHHASNPCVEVDGDTANGRWNVIVMVTSPKTQAFWLTAVYHDTFVRTPAGWRFKILKATIAAYAPYEAGWAKSQVPTTDQTGELTGAPIVSGG